MKMRMLKSPEEIELIKQGARIADLGGETAVKVIEEGVGEHEIALASTDAMVREIADTYPHSEIRDSKLMRIVKQCAITTKGRAIIQTASTAIPFEI